MELRHLRYFAAVAELLHFGRAAAHLQIAQPSLSHQILQLERELQATLLRRTTRRVQLTEPGRLFLQEAREILAHADRAAVVVRRASRGEVGTLRVAFAHWMDPTTIIASVKSFSGRHPAIQFDLQTMCVPLQVAALRDERLDVGFIRPPLGEPPLTSERVTAEPFVVALPASHRHAARGRLRLAALADEAFILVARGVVPIFYDLVLKVCRDVGFVPHVGHQVDDPLMVLGLVAAGVGVSLVPASARRTRPRGVVLRPLAPSPHILQTAVAWRADSSSPLVAGFLQVVRDVVARRARGADSARR
jgi:DNA-binding transcriptional LysR family regulator